MHESTTGRTVRRLQGLLALRLGASTLLGFAGGSLLLFRLPAALQLDLELAAALEAESQQEDDQG